MKSITINLKDLYIITSRYIDEYAKMCAIHYCEKIGDCRKSNSMSLYFDGIETNMKKLRKFVDDMTPSEDKDSHTFQGYEDIDFLFTFMQYVFIKEKESLSKHNVHFLDLVIQIADLMAEEAKEADETEYHADAIRFRNHVSEMKKNDLRIETESTETGAISNVQVDNTKKVKCCLCGKEIEEWETNNPFPIQANGRCCSDCNSNIVIPLRLRLMRYDKEE